MFKKWQCRWEMVKSNCEMLNNACLICLLIGQPTIVFNSTPNFNLKMNTDRCETTGKSVFMCQTLFSNYLFKRFFVGYHQSAKQFDATRFKLFEHF